MYRKLSLISQLKWTKRSFAFHPVDKTSCLWSASQSSVASAICWKSAKIGTRFPQSWREWAAMKMDACFIQRILRATQTFDRLRSRICKMISVNKMPTDCFANNRHTRKDVHEQLFLLLHSHINLIGTLKKQSEGIGDCKWKSVHIHRRPFHPPAR